MFNLLLPKKKNFLFREYEGRIGGDICISENIILENQSYTFFTNGDAMGKSLLGSGGALVLGASLGSILERNKFALDARNLTPEIWLKNTFTELHRLFSHFNSLMLMSIFIALIEESTGRLYYLNADHPFSVLLRDSHASFIDNEDSVYAKLGSPFTKKALKIRTLNLKPNDMIFIGSDGRDDIILNGETEISMNPERFLLLTEASNGSLEKLYNNILALGKVTDDISIMKVHYYGTS